MLLIVLIPLILLAAVVLLRTYKAQAVQPENVLVRTYESRRIKR
jgi:hypothetical protein